MPRPRTSTPPSCRSGFEEEDVHRFELHRPDRRRPGARVRRRSRRPTARPSTGARCDVAPEGEPRRRRRAVRGIVCGAHNFVVGDKVVVTLPGAVLPGPFPIAARKTYGHVSDGMIASARELGLGDEHDGILRLVDARPRRPRSARTRSRCSAWTTSPSRSTSRPTAATPSRSAASPASTRTRPARRSATRRDRRAASSQQPATGFAVAVDDQAPIRGRVGASRFVTRVVRGVDPTRPTPAVDGRPADARRHPLDLAPVDITNYVMLELGQPIHGYDLDKLHGRHHRAPRDAGREARDARRQGAHARPRRPAHHRRLRPDRPRRRHGRRIDRDQRRDDATCSSRRRTSTRSRSRAPPAGTSCRARRPSASSAASTPQVAGGRRGARRRSCSSSSPAARADAARLALHRRARRPAADRAARGLRRRRSIGVDYTDDEIASSLAEIGAIGRRRRPADCAVTPPTWRPDLTDKATLAEEVARIVGYDRIPSVLPSRLPAAASPARSGSAARVAHDARRQRRDRDARLPVRRREAATTCSARRRRDASPQIKLANPLDGEAPFLRTSLLPGLHRGRARATCRAASPTSRSSRSARCSCPRPARSYGSATAAARRGAAGAATPRRAEREHPAAAAHVARAVPRRRRREAARAGRGRARARATRSTPSRQLGARARRRRSRSRRGSTRRCTPAAPPSSASARRVVGFAGELLPVARRGPRPAARRRRARARPRRAHRAGASEVAGRRRSSTLPAATQDLSLVVARRRAGGRRARRRRRGRGRAARGRHARRRLPRQRSSRTEEVAHLRAALPRAGPHADGGRGHRGEARRTCRRRATLRRDPPRISSLARLIAGTDGVFGRVATHDCCVGLVAARPRRGMVESMDIRGTRHGELRRSVRRARRSWATPRR